MSYDVISLFSGCSGSDLGFEQAGFNIKLSVEIDRWACDSYEENFGVRPVEVPVEKIGKVGPCDIVIGGPPCQSFSHARSNSNRASGSGAKNIYSFIDVVNEAQPKLFIMENVPSLGLDSTFSSLYHDILTSFPEYYINPCVLSAEDYGVPQQRERLFVLGSKKEIGYFSKPIGTHWRNLYSGWADYLGLPNEGILIRRCSALRGKTPFEAAYTVQGADCMCLRMDRPSKLHGSILSNERVGINQRYLTVKEIAKLQGFPPEFIFCGNEKEQRKQIGNAWCVPVAQALAEKAKEILDGFNRSQNNKNASI